MQHFVVACVLRVVGSASFMYVGIFATFGRCCAIPFSVTTFVLMLFTVSPFSVTTFVLRHFSVTSFFSQAFWSDDYFSCGCLVRV